jgi:hypothetical protein
MVVARMGEEGEALDWWYWGLWESDWQNEWLL